MTIQLTRRSVALGAIAAATPFSAAAQAEPFTRIEAEIAAALAAHSLVGLTTAVVHRGEIVHVNGYGRASVPFSAPVTSQTLFQVGSLGKQFTAYAVLKLVEAGRIRLDQPVGAHVSGLPAAWGAATLYQLLHHIGGLPAYEGGEFEWDRPITRDSLIANAGETPYFPPGEAWVYSNTGYAVLGWLLEDVSGQSYADHIQTQIFAPLGMQDSRADDGEAAIVNRAEPYVMADGAIRHATRMTSSVSALGDGGLLVSARDYARWFQELRAPTLISAASERMMRAPAILNSGLRAPYGMGWVLDRVRGRELVAHSGGVPGFISYAIWSPQDDTASFVSSNLASSSAFAAARTLAMELATVHAPDISVRTLEPIRDRNLDRTAVARALLTRADALPDTSLFTPNMRRAFSEQTANDLAPRMPDLTDLTLVEELFFLGLRVHRYRMQRGSRPGPDHLLFAYDRAGRIAWIF